jgi:DNA-binding transcriptional ArsR family regulator
MGGSAIVQEIHFTPDDLARVTISAGPDLMVELAGSVHGLATGALDRKRRPRLTSTVGLSPMWPLFEFARALEWVPDFLTPGRHLAFAPGLAGVLATPARRLRSELAPFGGPAWMHDPQRLRGALRATLPAYYRDVFAPHWNQVTAHVLAERAARGQVLLDYGVHRLLATLHPRVRWDPPILRVWCPSDDIVRFYLRGRGLRLVPQYFQSGIALMDRPGEPLELMYPARLHITGGGASLHALLGRTRAAVLAAADGTTTSQLAQRVGISNASASEHATILRQAGLITTTQRGRCVVHALTPLGGALLRTTRPTKPGDVARLDA